MNSLHHKFPRSYKGEMQITKFLNLPSIGLICLGLFVWFVLYTLIGGFLPIVANTIGFLLTSSLYVLYMVKIPPEYYNKLANERLYKLLVLWYLQKKNRVIYTKAVKRDD